MPAGRSPASAWRRTSDGHPRIRIEVRLDASARDRALAEDVRRGLTASPRVLPPKYFYDEPGSALFERITRLPEYYLTRAEGEILGTHGAALMKALRPEDVVEIGAGVATKIRPLLRAKMSLAPFVSPATRLVANEVNATNRPSAEIDGGKLVSWCSSWCSSC